jgi:hypothetical protein
MAADFDIHVILERGQNGGFCCIHGRFASGIPKDPTFIPIDDFVGFFPKSEQTFLVELCSKYLSPLFMMVFPNVASGKAQQFGRHSVNLSSQVCYCAEYSHVPTVGSHRLLSDSRYSLLPVSLFVKPRGLSYSAKIMTLSKLSNEKRQLVYK